MRKRIMVKTIDKLTIGMFQRIHALDKEMNPATKSAHIAAIIKGTTYEIARTWKIDKVKDINLMFTTINFKPYEVMRVKKLKINGVNHKITDDPKDMTSGQLIDIIELMKGNDKPISYMDTALAIITKKGRKYDSKTTQERAAFIRDIPLKDVWGVWVFFWNLWIRYCTISEDYLDQQMKKTATTMKLLLKESGRGS